MNNFKKLISEKILVCDGAMGTELQKLGLTAQDYGGKEGCNDYLVLTKPQVVASVHESYLSAGADIIETCTFGASGVSLADYGLADKAGEINLAAARLARKAAEKYSGQKPRFVVGSIGPTAKSVFLGSVDFETLSASYLEQCLALIEGGVDFLAVETAQDMLNIKAALRAAFAARESLGTDTPVMVSASPGAGGLILSGQDAAALFVSLSHYDLAALGLNCSFGPAQLEKSLRELSAVSRFPLFAMPNAGLPDKDGNYKLSPDEFASKMAEFAKSGLLNIAGGCCGTTPEHIKALAAAVAGVKPRKPAASRWAVCGAKAVFADENPRPLIAGERTNSLGSKAFRELISLGKWDEAVDIARKQAAAGAHILDVCLANPARDEKADLEKLVYRLVRAVKIPLMIDTADFPSAKLAAGLCPGKCVWNSVNLEKGEERLAQGAELNRLYGAKLVVGCIDENREDGMAVSRERKLEIAGRAFSLLTGKFGVKAEDIIFDALVFPALGGQEKYSGAAKETVEAVRLLKKNFPECGTILGISNVSFGLPAAAREIVNSVFLERCVSAGLDIAIANPAALRREIPAEETKLAEAALFDGDSAAAAKLSGRRKIRQAEEASPEEKLRLAVLSGEKNGIEEKAKALLSAMSAEEIINGRLLSAMDEVGKKFSAGEMIITEVLESAAAMSRAAAFLEPFLKSRTQSRGRLLLATVEGDVHDIGKNLVAMIFKSGGFEVIDLGVKTPRLLLAQKAKELKPDVIGLSALLTQSALNMAEAAEELSGAGITAPLLAGGAALSEEFVRLKIAPRYAGRAIYAKDALEGLRLAVEALKP